MADYSEMTLIDANRILSEYSREAGMLCRLPGGAANSSFRVQTTRGESLVLTVMDNHTVASAEELADLLSTLKHQGVPVDGVLKTARGGGVVQGLGRPVMVRPFVDGVHPDPSELSALPQVGLVLGGIHGVPAPVGLRVGGRHLPRDWRSMLGNSAPGQLLAILDDAESIAENPEWLSLPTVLCHGDLFADNLIQRPDGRLVVLDWETASLDPAILDIGIALVAFWPAALRNGSRVAVAQFLSGYEKERQLSALELRQVWPGVFYAMSMLAFHRYYRHNIRFPDHRRSNLYQEMVDSAEGLKRMELLA